MTGSGGATLLHSDEGVIETSYGCVVVRTFDWGALSGTAPADNTLVTVADEEEQVDLWVLTADQWGPFSVTTRLWDAPPPDPGAEWEDVVELSVTSATGLSVTEMVDNEPQILLAPDPGQYRLRISARGRRLRDIITDDVAGDLDAELPPKEWYLLEVWPAPAADPVVVRLTSPHAMQVLDPPPALVIPEGEAGLAAAGRIGRDVDGKPGARSLSGRTGTVRVERTVRGTRRRLFQRCAHLVTWSHQWVDGPGWSWMGGARPGDDEYAPRYLHWASAHAHPDQLSGERGAIRYSYVEVEKPARAVRRWDWVVPPPGGDLVMINRVSFLAEPTFLTVELNELRDEAGDPWTTITIVHDDLPAEWLDDMQTYWDYQLSIADHAGFGVPT